MKRMKLETYGSKFKTIRLKQHLRSGSLIEKLNRYIFVQLKHNLNQKSKGNQNKTASIDFIKSSEFCSNLNIFRTLI